MPRCQPPCPGALGRKEEEGTGLGAGISISVLMGGGVEGMLQIGSASRELLCGGWGDARRKGKTWEREQSTERSGEREGAAQGYRDRVVRLASWQVWWGRDPESPTLSTPTAGSSALALATGLG